MLKGRPAMWLSHRLAYTRPSSGEENDAAGTGGVSPNKLSSSNSSRMTPSSARALRRLPYRRPRSWGCRDAAGFSSRVFFSLAAMRRKARCTSIFRASGVSPAASAARVV